MMGRLVMVMGLRWLFNYIGYDGLHEVVLGCDGLPEVDGDGPEDGEGIEAGDDEDDGPEDGEDDGPEDGEPGARFWLVMMMAAFLGRLVM